MSKDGEDGMDYKLVNVVRLADLGIFFFLKCCKKKSIATLSPLSYINNVTIRNLVEARKFFFYLARNDRKNYGRLLDEQTLLDYKRLIFSLNFSLQFLGDPPMTLFVRYRKPRTR